jgi:hypothetical protein
MATYYEIKELVCRIFGYRDIEINDEDVSVVIKNRRMSDSEYSFVLKDNELKEIYEKINHSRNEGLELIVDNNYEIAIDIDTPLLRRHEFPIMSVDNENQIDYEIGYYSIEYFIFLLDMLIEKRRQPNRRLLLPIQFRRVLEFRVKAYEDDEIDWKKVLVQGIGELSLKIHDTNCCSIDKFRRKKSAYVFELMYKSEFAIIEQSDLEMIFPARELARDRIDITTLETIPHREYISDVVDYYRLAISSADSYIKFISFYHVMEYFYDEVYRKKIVEELQEKITHPDFSYRNEDKVYEIATFVKNRMHMNDESGQGDELESLKYVLKEYVDIEQLKEKVKAIDAESVQYYQNTKVSFCKAPIIPWNDAEGVYTHIAKRIYYTRNSLIHSKSGKNRDRYKPYSDEKVLQCEIPLVKVIAEMIIINSSKIV